MLDTLGSVITASLSLSIHHHFTLLPLLLSRLQGMRWPPHPLAILCAHLVFGTLSLGKDIDLDSSDITFGGSWQTDSVSLKDEQDTSTVDAPTTHSVFASFQIDFDGEGQPEPDPFQTLTMQQDLASSFV